jgi:hypothetical protein
MPACATRVLVNLRALRTYFSGNAVLRARLASRLLHLAGCSASRHWRSVRRMYSSGDVVHLGAGLPTCPTLPLQPVRVAAINKDQEGRGRC